LDLVVVALKRIHGLQPTQSPHLKKLPFCTFNNDEEDLVAVATAGDEAHGWAKNDCLAQRCDISTRPTLPFCGRRLEVEEITDRTGQNVAVEMIH